MAKAKPKKALAKPAAKAKSTVKAKPSSNAKPSSKDKPAAQAKSFAKAKPATVSQKKALPKAKPVSAAKPSKAAPAKVVTKPAPAARPSAKAAPAPAKTAVAKPPLPLAKGRGPVIKGKGPVGRLMPAPIEPPKNGKHPFLNKTELAAFRQILLNLRDRYVDEIGFLTGDSLARNSREASGDLSNYSLHMADQGTDNFDREFALNLASGDQDVLYEIDEALQRIEQNTYGICELTQQPIEKERLKAMPHTRYCLQAQSELERGKPRFRPFGPTLSQL